MKFDQIDCQVCGKRCSLLDVVDLNKACLMWLRLSGEPVYYAICGDCGFCFAPQFAEWSLKDFEEKIYNKDYVMLDPDYIEKRPRENCGMLVSMFPAAGTPGSIKHLDYGGGNGTLSRLLREAGWDSSTYDPFVDKGLTVDSLGKFDLITAFEVFEHVPDVPALMANLRTLLAPGGMVLFSTLVSDGHIEPKKRLDWWYAAPRNGHIALFSKKSLGVLAQNSKLKCGSFSDGLHTFFATVPPWAAHLLQPA